MGFQGVCDLWIFVIEHASLEGRIVKTLYSQCRVNVEAGLAFRSPMQNAISPNQSTFAMLISNNPPLRYCDTLTHQHMEKQQGFGFSCNWYTKNSDLRKPGFPRNTMKSMPDSIPTMLLSTKYRINGHRSSAPSAKGENLNGFGYYTRFSGIESFWNMVLQFLIFDSFCCFLIVFFPRTCRVWMVWIEHPYYSRWKIIFP
jgi:hypothetical protein